MSFSPSGEKLAIGISYAWDEGEEGLKKEGGKVVEVKIRKVGDEGKVSFCVVLTYAVTDNLPLLAESEGLVRGRYVRYLNVTILSSKPSTDRTPDSFKTTR